MRLGSLSLSYVVIGLVVVATAVTVAAGSTESIGGFFDTINEQLASAEPDTGQQDATGPGSTTGADTDTSDTTTSASTTSTSVTPPEQRPVEFRPGGR